MSGLHVQGRAGLLSAILALGVAHAIPAQARSCVDPTDSLASSARWTPPLDRAVTLQATDVSLRDALDRIAAIAKLRVSYSAELLPLDRAVCVAANQDPVGKIFGALLRGTNLTVVAAGGDQVVLTPRSKSATRDSATEMLRAVSVLDRVVVTGSAAGTPQREVTIGVDVIDGRQLARDHTNTLAGALDAYVPGMWSWTQSPSNMLNSYASIRGASSFGLSYPKIYIDGIEVANPLLVSRFNPSAIDRIEVIRGPQGSALYGTDAISGVINIVTRHEGSNGDGSHASVRTAAGFSQSSYARDVLAQDHALSIVTGSSTRSADLHISAGSIGSFIPEGYRRDMMATGSARMVGARATFAATARFFAAEAGTPNSPLVTAPPVDRSDSLERGSVVRQSTDAPQSVRQYTFATTTSFAPDQAWTHSLVAGVDGYRLANVQANLTPIRSPVDSALRAAQGGADRATIRASSVLHVANGESSRATLTFSAEHARLRETSVNNTLAEPPGRGTAPRPLGVRQLVTWQNSTGLTTQANLAYSNSFFVTGGVRIEHDSRLAPLEDFVVLPMLGSALVRDYGALSVKLRAAYGKGIRPPSTVGHSAFWQTSSGVALQSMLGPEVQSGTEAGIDLSFKRGPSLQITRFDQRASGLVQQVPVDTDTAFPARRVTYGLENVGEISNRGWEVEASGNLSRLAITGGYSYVDSRVQKLAKGYNGDLASGDRILQVPAHTASLTFSWLANRWSSSLGASRAFDWINYDELALTKAFLNGTHQTREPLGPQLRQYWRRYNGGLRLRASASRDIRDMFSIDISADNLLNHQRGEPDNITVVPGRTIMSGVRVKF